MLEDRSSAPVRCSHRPADETVAEIERLRRQRMTGPQIARQLAMPRSTVGAALRAVGLGCLSALDPKPPVVRYERAAPGELIDIDTKKLGEIDGIGHRITGNRRGQKRGIGWDLSMSSTPPARLHSSLVLREEGERLRLPDPGPGLLRPPWRHRQSRDDRQRLSLSRTRDFRHFCAAAGIRHIRTRQDAIMNGKAERFIQTSLASGPTPDPTNLRRANPGHGASGLHGSATTTHAVRAAIQRSKAPLKELAERYGLNPKTVAKWRKRTFVARRADGAQERPARRC